MHKPYTLNSYYYNIKFSIEGDSMCIPHGASGGRSNGFEKDDKPKKHIKKVSKSEFEKGDPDFVDERNSSYIPKKKKSSFFSLLK